MSEWYKVDILFKRETLYLVSESIYVFGFELDYYPYQLADDDLVGSDKLSCRVCQKQSVFRILMENSLAL